MFKHRLSRMALIILLAFSSCIDVVPPEEPDPNKEMQDLLMGAQYHMSEFMGGDFSRFPLMWMQQLSGVRGTHLQVERYGVQSGNLDDIWRIYYLELLQRFVLLEYYAVEWEAPAYQGVAKVMRAYMLGMGTDAWGDMPYTDAYMYFGYGNTPKYDPQEDLYKEVIKLLDDAVALLQTADLGPFVPGYNTDFFYQGALEKWVRAARLLKVRFSLRTAHKQQDYAPLLQMIEAGGLLNDKNDDWYFPYNSSAQLNNPWYYFDHVIGNTRVGARIVNLLKDTDDPRMPRFIRLNLSNEYVGAAPGSAHLDASRTSNTNSGIGQSNSPLTLLSFAEQKFIEAEVYLRNGLQSRADEAYNQAVLASLDMYNARNNAWETIHANKSGVTIEDIIHAKYIALFLNPEVWTDWRRTAYPALNPPASNLNEDQIPRRFIYPNSESSANTANVPKDIDLNVPVWWDAGEIF